jgi:hypothetical protein
MMFPRSIILSGWLLPLTAWCGSSQNYTLEHGSIDNGGSLTVSANYVADMSSTPGTAAASANYANRAGYAGQLADVVAIEVAAASAGLTIVERGTKQLVAVLTYDDASFAAPAAGRVSWSVSGSSLLNISSTGVATAGSVYQNTEAAVGASYLNFSDTLNLVVLNSGTDDFGPYAADRLPDTWQVQYFGESGIQTAAGADADSDGLSNLLEFAFGTDPMTTTPSAINYTADGEVSPGRQEARNLAVGPGVAFRAVFGRRKDYVAAGLTYTVQFSAGLDIWVNSKSTPTRLSGINSSGPIDAVAVPYPLFIRTARGVEKPTFFRIAVSQSP